MFQTLTDKLTLTLKRITGKGRLTEENIQETLREVRAALLDADVALPIVMEFTDKIRSQALGAEVLKSLQPGEAFVKIVHDGLIELLGKDETELKLQTKPPVIILMAGLQGSGKTTTVAKLAKWLQSRHQKRVLVTSADIYRPAAIEQLKTLATQIQVGYFPSTGQQSPITIAENAVAEATSKLYDVVIIDTAGRLHIDADMMSEIQAIHKAISPTETLFVVDSMTGQDAAHTAKAFHDALPLTGVILTKTDGDARGGAALSVRQITGKPIKFMGIGEKIDDFEPFFAERMASRILGMGDVLSLVEEVQRKVDQEKVAQLEKKLKKQKEFDLEDFREQLQQMSKMGGLSGLLGKIPGMGQMQQAVQTQINDKVLNQMQAIILSMTPKERRYIHLINASRKRRIAHGSGTQVQDVNRLLKQFTQTQKMMKKLKGGDSSKMMQQLKSRMPGGFSGRAY